MTLFFKECKKTLRSIPYLLLVAVLIQVFCSQVMPELKALEKPEPGESDYGQQSVEDPEIIMPAALQSLYGEFCSNSYTAYPIGFHKIVRLNEKKQAKIAAILSELTGLTEDELLLSAGIFVSDQSVTVGDDGAMQTDGNGNYVYSVPQGEESGDAENAATTVTLGGEITYAQFLELMDEADRLIGGGSKYGDMFLVNNFGQVPISYEEALAGYNAMIETDKITGAYSRVFCDYLGLMAGILPLFMAVGSGLKDKRHKMQELIYTRSASSAAVIGTRFLAMLLMAMLPILLLAAYATVIVSRMYSGMSLDYFAFFRDSVIWLAPTVMTSLAAGMVLTELTDTPIAVPVYGLWWFLGLFAGMAQLNGGYGGLVLVIRHNMLGNTQVYLDCFGTLVYNRVFYAGLSLVLIALTALSYEMKRRGRLNVGGRIKRLRGNRKGKQPA